MRVLHVIPAVAPRYGGPSHAVVAMCRELIGAGVEPLIASTDADGESVLDLPLGIYSEWQGVPAIFFHRQWSEAYKYSRPLARWLRDHIDAFPVVHIHAVFSHSCLAAAALCRRRSIPYIVRPLGTLDPWSFSRKRLRKVLAWRLAARSLVAGAATIHYATVRERERAQMATGIPGGRVIHPGVDIGGDSPSNAPTATSTETPYVLFLSRLHPKKGVDLLIDAFLDLTENEEFSHWRLVVAGSGDRAYEAQLRSRMEVARGNGRVHFTGWLDGAEKAAFLNGAALLALPSYQENLGFCIIEALARGVPVLVSDRVDLAAPIARNHAGWVSSLDRGDLRTTLAVALRDGEERVRRGGAGREWARRDFSWQACSRSLLALYEEVAARGR